MKYYILLSRDKSLRYDPDNCLFVKHLQTIPREDLIVVINSLDKDYVERATDYCWFMGIEHYVTESDGTPSTGKNSLIRLFLESTHEYMVAVDGDDIVTEYGVEFYRQLSEHPSPPDVVALVNQWSKVATQFTKDKNGNDVVETWSRTKGWAKLDKEINECLPTDWTYWWRKQRCHGPEFDDHDMVYDWCDDNTLMEWAKSRVAFEKLCWKMSKPVNNKNGYRDVFNRMVFFSRKGASHINYDPKLLVGEDTMQWWEIKQKGVRGELDVAYHDEEDEYTYLYSPDPTGVVMNKMKEDIPDGRFSYEWMVTLMDYIIESNLETKYEDTFYKSLRLVNDGTKQK